jgi:hypothetical protein
MKRTSLILLAAGTLIILAILSASWLTSSPRSLRRATEAIVLIAGTVSALGRVRRVTSATPAVLYTTVIVGLVVIARPGGPLFPIVLSAGVALAWASVFFVQKARTKGLT